MKAVIYNRYGPADVVKLVDVPRPVPKPGQIFVAVRASAVTTADSMIRQGMPRWGRLFLGLRRPRTTAMGTQFAGEVIEVGADVKGFRVGDRVFGETGMAFGAHAEFISINADEMVAHIPEGMSFEEAAPLCDGPLTDMNFLRNLADLKPGQHILINGAAGSLGSAAVQLAKSLGAEVTGVCSTRNVDFVRSLGADHIIDYIKEDFTRQREVYDVIFDTVGKSDFRSSKPALKRGGAYISPVLSFRLLGNMLWSDWFGSKKAKFSATGMMPVDQQKPLLRELLDRIAQGHLKMVIDKRFGLDQIVEAHAYVDTGHKRGNVILQVG
ncbi:NAD(P)-dependent alcohol dehydrogenase [Cognatiyoonia sp. IB215446]|uniref:NAD(P)-dependent alcohol dehydrogenase n=1 Tax=Cognatiyoonia sp. IB215446 TaxID=3097355 RepID=UPI002A1035E4|nr:NAD(P)-dependent alcohol dehydrogenase [Cognatiyoonia sp. IB215446]MDX8350280.1 NAD(P)-dependent alcohol dehydrogenase [Cognatiyoonia sp. IB215446]